MRLAVITHAEHGKDAQGYYAYGPYVREMNLWFSAADQVEVVAPLTLNQPSPIHLYYTQSYTALTAIPSINFQTVKNILRSILQLPIIVWHIFWAMKRADHIHLRCPGNIGLLGALLQILFPFKPKTAKYAGNWDPNSPQPVSYRLQKWILSSTLLTRKMQVLVYGDWPDSSANCKPFFTATYRENEIQDLPVKPLQPTFEWLFVGSLAVGKQPLYALELFAEFEKKFPDSRMRFFGEGVLRSTLTAQIDRLGLSQNVFLMGNQTKEVVEQSYRDSHFLVLVSKSEGWPKVVAEAMFWGCVPLASSVSCVPYMLDDGQRGLLLSGEMTADQMQIAELVNHPERYEQIRQKGIEWSQYYTLDLFEREIRKLITCE